MEASDKYEYRTFKDGFLCSVLSLSGLLTSLISQFCNCSQPKNMNFKAAYLK